MAEENHNSQAHHCPEHHKNRRVETGPDGSRCYPKSLRQEVEAYQRDFPLDNRPCLGVFLPPFLICGDSLLTREMARLERCSLDKENCWELKLLDQKMIGLDEMGQEHPIRLPEDEEEVVARYRRVQRVEFGEGRF